MIISQSWLFFTILIMILVSNIYKKSLTVDYIIVEAYNNVFGYQNSVKAFDFKFKIKFLINFLSFLSLKLIFSI